MNPSVTLKENYEFRRLYQKGASAVGGGMVIYCRRNRFGRNRLGLTVSVKIGNAVKRNRARRRLREVYRLNSPRLKEGWDIVIVARGRALTAPWREMNDTFLRLCRKLDLLKDAPKVSEESKVNRVSKVNKVNKVNKEQKEQKRSGGPAVPEQRDPKRAAKKDAGKAEDKP